MLRGAGHRRVNLPEQLFIDEESTQALHAGAQERSHLERLPAASHSASTVDWKISQSNPFSAREKRSEILYSSTAVVLIALNTNQETENLSEKLKAESAPPKGTDQSRMRTSAPIELNRPAAHLPKLPSFSL